jgi:hypothetical protein
LVYGVIKRYSIQGAKETNVMALDKVNEQREQFEAFKSKEEARGFCPYSGLTIPACKSWLCDCFDFENEYGTSKK